MEFHELCDTDLEIISVGGLLHQPHSGYTPLSYGEMKLPVVAQDYKSHPSIASQPTNEALSLASHISTRSRLLSGEIS